MSTSSRERGDLEDLTFYVLQSGRQPWDAERDMQLIRERGGIVIDDPAEATIVIIDTPAARLDTKANTRVYKYAEPLAADAPVDKWTADRLVRRFAHDDSGTFVIHSKWLTKKRPTFGPLYGGCLVRGLHVPEEPEDEEEDEPEPPMPPIPSDHDDDYDPDLRETAISPNRKGKARADSDTEYSPRKRARGANGKHKAVESPRRRGRRKADSSSDIEFVGSSQPKTWRRFLLSDTEEEPVKRSAGQPRQSIGTARTASQQATPRTAVSRRTPSGPIFAAGRYPLTFYVAPSDNDLLERLIPSEGGGDLVPASEANIIILPLAQGDAPATREHRKLVETARGGLGRVVSEDWAWDCFRARPPALLDLDEYEVRLEEAGSSQRSVPRSSQKSAPSSSQRPAPSSSQRPTASAVTTPAKRRRDSSVAFEEDHRWDSARKKSHEIAYYDDEEIDFGGILEEHVERVELLIHYLRRWDKNGNKDDFIKSLGKTNSVRGAADIYYNKGYQQLIDRQVPGLLRAARRAAGSSPRQPKSQVTPSKSQPTPSRSQPTPTKPAKTTPAANDINIHHVKEEHKDRVIELVRALRAWDKVGSKSQKLKDLGPEIPGAMTLYYAYRDLVDEQVPGL